MDATGEQMEDHMRKIDRPVPALPASLRSVVCVAHATMRMNHKVNYKINSHH